MNFNFTRIQVVKHCATRYFQPIWHNRRANTDKNAELSGAQRMRYWQRFYANHKLDSAICINFM